MKHAVVQRGCLVRWRVDKVVLAGTTVTLSAQSQARAVQHTARLVVYGRRHACTDTNTCCSSILSTCHSPLIPSLSQARNTTANCTTDDDYSGNTFGKVVPQPNG